MDKDALINNLVDLTFYKMIVWCNDDGDLKTTAFENYRIDVNEFGIYLYHKVKNSDASHKLLTHEFSKSQVLKLRLAIEEQVAELKQKEELMIFSELNKLLSNMKRKRIK